MAFALFITWPSDSAPAAPCSASLDGVSGLRRVVVLRSAEVIQGVPQDTGEPAQCLQLEFDDIAALEEAAKADHPLCHLTKGAADQQAFLLRRYKDDTPPGSHCSYMVHYPGPAENTEEWLRHYRSQHIPLMCRLPRIRGVEMLTRIDWISSLPLAHAKHMQRNRVVFDSSQELRAALQSSVRDEMRADVAQYPRFEGGVFHHVMTTEVIYPAHSPDRRAIS
ncbi:EthD family reductase [Paracoccus albus]|uniref:EthD family reductase n=1 Tax=Paracoccus albus TaxID=3017784 RepID=UPI0022F08E8C|nr:EthD family reductase [Paracoccus albus]WBU58860.1 EthD family reductase [Paracoccus albus]